MVRTSDSGRLGERVASVNPADLHQAVVTSALAALRHGAGVELLDGLEFWRMSDMTARVADNRSRRLELLREQHAEARASYENARSNANGTTNERLRADFLSDSEKEAERVADLEQEILETEAQPETSAAPGDFDSDCDFVAHGLAGLVRYGEHAPAEFVEALSRVLEFTDFRAVHTTDPPQLEVTFHLLLPADGRVARFGPITCSVANRAYRNTLRDGGEAERVRALLHQRIRRRDRCDLDAAPHRALESLARMLAASQRWTALAAGTLARSGLAPLFDIAAHLLWADELPDDVDAGYVNLVTSTYGDPDFAWNSRHHALDCRLRQRCVDAVVAAGGHLGFAQLEVALAGTRVNDTRITIFSRTQTSGNTPPWLPCLERRGDWIQQHPKSGRSLAAVRCPHCTGWASKVVRTPETPSCLLCPDCRRMPTAESPVFPEVYLRL